MSLSPSRIPELAQFSCEHAGEPTLWMDSTGQILYANAAAGSALRCDATTLVGRTLFQIAPELNGGLWRELWKELRATNQFAFEFNLEVTEDQSVEAEIVIHRTVIASEEWAVLFFADVSERKRLKTLEQGFVSTVSHELRTPLTVIREGVAQVLDGLRGEINPGQNRALTIALSGIDRLARLIDELLDLSKMESGKVRLKLERVDLGVLVQEIASSFQSIAADRHLRLHAVLPGTPAITFAARDRVIQVLTNLLTNAFKFTEKGEVRLHVESLPEGVRCQVQDTGIGFAPENAERIFNRFEQLDALAVTGEKGTGLGLSICKGIVELHGGRLVGESKGPGTGSCFTFTLPRRDAASVFREEIKGQLEEIKLRGGSLSALCFYLHGGDLTGPDVDGLALVEKLEQVVQRERGRRSDILVKDSRVLYAAFTSTVQKEAARMADRVLADFQILLAQASLAPRVRVTVRITSFPEHTSDIATFLQRAAAEGR